MSVTRPRPRDLLRAMRSRKDEWLATRLAGGCEPEERAALERAAAVLERVLEDGPA